MKKFFYRILLLFTLLLVFIYLMLEAIPHQAIHHSLYYSHINKFNLLKSTPSPKVVLVGGSNLSFGVNSAILSDSLKRPVINMAIHSSLGLYFMIREVVPFLKKDDLLIVSPEYQLFYGNYAYGTKELLYMAFDVDPKLKKYLSVSHWCHLIKYMPEYLNEKLMYIKNNHWTNPLPPVKLTPGIYDREAFNDYGDVYLHRNLPNQEFHPHKLIQTSLNENLLKFLSNEATKLEEKDILTLFIYPVYQESSFVRNAAIIENLHEHLKATEILFTSIPQKYCFADSLFFNTPYHLNGSGVEKRSQMILGDIVESLYFQN